MKTAKTWKHYSIKKKIEENSILNEDRTEKSREHLTRRMNQTENRPLGFKGKVQHLDKVHEFFITEEHEKLIKHTRKKHVGNVQRH